MRELKEKKIRHAYINPITKDLLFEELSQIDEELGQTDTGEIIGLIKIQWLNHRTLLHVDGYSSMLEH